MHPSVKSNGHDDDGHVSDHETLLTAALRASYVLFQPVVAAGGTSLHGYQARLTTATAELSMAHELDHHAQTLGRLDEVHQRTLSASLDLIERGRVAGGRRLFVPCAPTSLDSFSGLRVLEHGSQLVMCLPVSTWIAPTATDRARITAMRDAGVLVALTMYGPCTASVSALRPHDVDYVLVDPTMVRGLDQQPPYVKSFLRMLFDLCASMSIAAVASEVGTTEDLGWLCEAGCSLVSGPVCGEEGPPFPPPRFRRTHQLEVARPN